VLASPEEKQIYTALLDLQQTEKDETGLFRGASSRTIEGISDPATLEAMACAEALSRAEDLGISKMEVTADCLKVINMMKERSLCSYSTILHEIAQKSRSYKVISFKFESRETNGDAHLVARNSISQPFGRHVWYVEPPDFVSMIIPIE
jgi:ribonuclease HI